MKRIRRGEERPLNLGTLICIWAWLIISAVPWAAHAQLEEAGVNTPLPALKSSGPPILRDPSVDSTIPFEGNWHVRWQNTVAGEETQALVSLQKGLTLGCPEGGSCTMHFFRDPNASWSAVGMAMTPGPTGDSWERFSAEVNVGTGGIGLKHGYSVLGYWGGRETVTGAPDSDTLQGEWSYGDARGGSIWRRIEADIDRVEFSTKQGDSWRSSTTVPGSEVARVEMTWDDFWWGPKNNMRGNRPSFHISVRGANFWGHHYPWIDPATRIEIQRPVQNCVDGSGFHYEYWFPCISGGGVDGTVGLSFEVVIWPGVTPGLKVLYVNGTEIPFELVIHGYPEAPAKVESISALTVEGTLINQIDRGEPFELVARLDRPSNPGEFPSLQIKVLSDSDSIVIDGALGEESGPEPTIRRPGNTILLYPTADPQLYRGRRPFILAEDSATTPATQFDDARNNESEATKAERAQLAQDFTGEWRTNHISYEETPVGHGIAHIDALGNVHLDLGESGSWFAVEVVANRYRPGSGPFLGSAKLVFERYTEPANADSSPCSLADSVSNQPDEGGDTQTIPLGAAATSVEFTRDNQSARIEVLQGEPRSERLAVNLLVREHFSNIDGTWEIRGPDNERRGDGYATWVRGEPSANILVLTDQTDVRRASHPYRDDPDLAAQRTRRLLVFGRNLPDRADGASIVSQSENITYVSQGQVSKLTHKILLERLRSAGVGDPNAFDLIEITAELHPGVAPGEKELTINGAQARWPLVFADYQARFRFVRIGGNAVNEATDVMFPGDRGYLELAFANAPALSRVEAVLVRKKDRDGSESGGSGIDAADEEDLATLGNIGLSPAVDLEPGTFRSSPIHFASATRNFVRPPDEPNATVLAVKPGQRFAARLAVPSIAFTAPVEPAISIHNVPRSLGQTWQDALEKVQACHGGDANDPGFPFAVAEHHWRFIFTEGVVALAVSMHRPLIDLAETLTGANLSPKLDVVRTTAILNGDHAAALLLRDEFISSMNRAIESYEAWALAPGAGSRIYRLASQTQRAKNAAQDDPFWVHSKATWTDSDGDEIEVPLWHTLDTNYAYPKVRINSEQLERWGNQETAKALGKQAENMRAARRRATNADSCDLDELFALVGFQSPKLVERVKQRLVQVRHTDTGPLRQYIEDDRLAQGFVASGFVLGETMRATDQYADIDDAYLAGAIAVATAGTGFLLYAGGEAGLALAALIIGDLGDAAYFGTKGVLDHYAAERDFHFAVGAESAFGEGRIDAAASARSSETLAWVGVIAPAVVGPTGSILDFRRLRSLANIQAGRRVLSADPDALTHLGRYADEDRVAMAAYYQSLLAKEAGSELLDDIDGRALANFKAYFGAAADTQRVPERMTDFFSEDLAAAARGGANPTPVPRQVGIAVEPPGGLPRAVYRQELCDSCGAAAARSVLERATGKSYSEEQMVAWSKRTGKGYMPGVGTYPRGLIEILEEGEMVAYAPRFTPDADTAVAGGATASRRFSVDDVRRELDAGNQVLAVVDYRRGRGQPATPHWVVIEKVSNGRVRGPDGTVLIDGPYVVIGDPAFGRSVALSRDDFLRHWRPDYTVVAAQRGAPGAALPASDWGTGAAGNFRGTPANIRQNLENMERAGDIDVASAQQLVDEFDEYRYWLSLPEENRFPKRMEELTTNINRRMRELRGSENGRQLQAAIGERYMLKYGTAEGDVLGQRLLGGDFEDYVPSIEDGIPNTTPALRDGIQGKKYVGLDNTMKDANGPMQADHIQPVTWIRDLLDEAGILDRARRASVYHNHNNIQPLPRDLNIRKSNREAQEWLEAERAKYGSQCVAADYDVWLTTEQSLMKRMLKAQVACLQSGKAIDVCLAEAKTMLDRLRLEEGQPSRWVNRIDLPFIGPFRNETYLGRATPTRVNYWGRALNATRLQAAPLMF